MRKSIDPMEGLGKAGNGNGCRRSPRSSAAMSFLSAIPRQDALQQSLPLLHRLETSLNNPRCRTMILQRTATTPLMPCLTQRVHSTIFPSPASAVVAVSRGRPATEVGRAPVDKLRYNEPVVAGGAVVVRPRPLFVPPGRSPGRLVAGLGSAAQRCNRKRRCFQRIHSV